jgi:replicative DNA helicase
MSIDRHAERALLGALLLDPSQIAKAARRLPPSMIGWTPHRQIYQVMIDLGERADLVTVTNRLASLGRLDDVGGATYLTALLTEVTVSALWPEYAEIVLRAYRVREIRAVGERLQHVTAEDAEDEAELASARLLELRRGAASVTIERMPEANLAALARLDRDHEGQILGVPYPLPQLNAISGGQLAGEVVVVVGLTGSGKSIFVDQSSVVAAKRGPALLCSNEMLPVDYHLRLLAREARVRLRRFRHPKQLTDGEMGQISRVMGEVADWPLYRCGNVFTVRALRLAIDAVTDDCGRPPVWAAIDWGQRLRPTRRRESRVAELDDLADEIMETAMTVKIPIMVAAQIDKHSAMSGAVRAETVRGGLGMAFAASVMIAIVLEDSTGQDDRRGSLVITKGRNIPEATIPVMLCGPFAQFVELDERAVLRPLCDR